MADNDDSPINLPGTILSLISTPPLAGSTPTGSAEPSNPVSTPSSHSHAGAIAGGVIGGLALLSALVGAFLYYRYKRRPAAYRARQRRGSIAAAHASNTKDVFSGSDTLVDEDAFKMIPKRSGSYVSKPGVYESTSSIGHGRLSVGQEEDRSRTPSTLHGHKSLESTEEIPAMPLDYLPTAPANVAQADGRMRSRAVMDHNRAEALAALDGSSPRTSFAQYSPTQDIADARASTSRPSSIVMLGRSESMTRGNRTSRRATRKAVPKYDNGEFSNPASPTYPPISPISASDFREDVRTGSGAGSSPAHMHSPMSRSRENLVAAGYDLPNLNHKSSFGNKQMHYLIPDPPPPQID